jgi:hypothetical protein
MAIPRTSLVGYAQLTFGSSTLFPITWERRSPALYLGTTISEVSAHKYDMQTLTETITLSLDDAQARLAQLHAEREAHRSLQKYFDVEIETTRVHIKSLETIIDGLRSHP